MIFDLWGLNRRILDIIRPVDFNASSLKATILHNVLWKNIIGNGKLDDQSGINRIRDTKKNENKSEWKFREKRLWKKINNKSFLGWKVLKWQNQPTNKIIRESSACQLQLEHIKMRRSWKTRKKMSQVLKVYYSYKIIFSLTYDLLYKC